MEKVTQILWDTATAILIVAFLMFILGLMGGCNTGEANFCYWLVGAYCLVPIIAGLRMIIKAVWP